MNKKTKVILLLILCIVILLSFLLFLSFGKKSTDKEGVGEKDKITVEQNKPTDEEESDSGVNNAGTQDEIVLPEDHLKDNKPADNFSSEERDDSEDEPKPDSEEKESSKRDPIILPAIPLG